LANTVKPAALSRGTCKPGLRLWPTRFNQQYFRPEPINGACTLANTVKPATLSPGTCKPGLRLWPTRFNQQYFRPAPVSRASPLANTVQPAKPFARTCNPDLHVSQNRSARNTLLQITRVSDYPHNQNQHTSPWWQTSILPKNQDSPVFHSRRIRTVRPSQPFASQFLRSETLEPSPRFI
jgi:hypothetical protein